MKLIFAQGNPGTQYESTRHNIGFMIIDSFALKREAVFKSKPKFHADIAELSLNGEKVILAKPTTYYNETGQSARALVDFYKLDPALDILVVHDDLALPFGTLRTRGKGSDAGNNGIKSLNAHLGEDYARLRVGIENDRTHIPDVDFVLGSFNTEEREALKDVLARTNPIIESFVSGSLAHTTHRSEK
jgi:PTH1 family peptidyl-tRNA hydrolase